MVLAIVRLVMPSPPGLGVLRKLHDAIRPDDRRLARDHLHLVSASPLREHLRLRLRSFVAQKLFVRFKKATKPILYLLLTSDLLNILSNLITKTSLVRQTHTK